MRHLILADRFLPIAVVAKVVRFPIEVLVRMLRPLTLGSWALATLLTALTGPLGTYSSYALPERLVYWGGFIGASILLATALLVLSDRHTLRFGYWPVALARVLVFTGLFTWFLHWFHCVVLDFDISEMPPVWYLALVVFTVALWVNIFHYFLTGAGRAAAEADASAPEDSTAEPRLLRRLSADMGSDILHLSVDDHYVEVVTARGRQRLLMRFVDALDELEGLDGLRVHRSHWIAPEAVVRHQRERGRDVLVLKTGAHVPVSRKYRAAVRAAGLI